MKILLLSLLLTFTLSTEPKTYTVRGTDIKVELLDDKVTIDNKTYNVQLIDKTVKGKYTYIMYKGTDFQNRPVELFFTMKGDKGMLQITITDANNPLKVLYRLV